jgi:NADPH2:quinone reductase
MQAVICARLGQISDLRLGAFPEPVITSKQVLIHVAIAGVNFPDQLIVKGQYQASPALPFVPGFEVAGTVLSVGPAVEGLAPGDRVVALTHGNHGGYAEMAVADSDRVMVMPAGLEFESAAAFYSSYGTAYHALIQRGYLKAGETLVVLGAGGGLGLAAVEIGKLLGARVIAIAGSDAKLEAAHRHGAEFCINHNQEDVRVRIDTLTAGQGADVCMDSVGGKLFDIMSRKMSWNGRLLVLGFASGIIPALSANLPMLKCYQMVGVFWDSFCRRYPETNRQNFVQLFAWFKDGLIRPEIHHVYALDDFRLALDELGRGQCIGRVLLDVRAERPN